MKKRIITTLLSTAVISLSVCAPVGAAFSNEVYYIDYSNSNVTISMETGISEMNMSLMVLENGETLSAETDVSDLQYQKVIKTDENGKVSHTFPLNIADGNEDLAATYNAYAKIAGSSADQLFDGAITYMSKEERKAFIANFQTNVTTIKTFLDNASNRYMLGITDDAAYAALDKDDLAATLLGKFSDYAEGANAGNGDNFTEACSYARQLFVVELFNQGKANLLFDVDGNYKYESYLDFAEYDEENEANIYSSFSTLVSEAGKDGIISSLMSKEFAKPTDLYKLLAKNTILIGLTNPKESGWGHVEAMLSAGNCQLIDLRIGTMSDNVKTKVPVKSGGYSSVTDLQNYIASEIAKENQGGGTQVSRPVISGGGVGAGITTPVPQAPVETPTVIFKDVTEDHWAVEGIAYLKAKNVVNGVSDGYFDPNGLVTREQLVKMIFAIANVELVQNAEPVFEDTPKNIWYTDYIVALNKAGYINGVSATEFGVGAYATRQDICTIVNRILGLEGSGTPNFTDSDNIAEYALDAVAALNANNIVNGYPDGTFKPYGNCTRAEAATIIYRASKFMEVK